MPSAAARPARQPRASRAGVDPLPRYGAIVALRRLAAADLAAFQAYRGDPDVGRYQGWTVLSDHEARAFLAEMSAAPLFRPGHWIQLGIADPRSLALLGDVGLFLSDDATQAEVGFTLARAAQGRGVATAAVREALRLVFERTSVQRVVGITDARNLASVRVLERLGMRRQAERRAPFRGEPCAEYVYVLAREAGPAAAPADRRGE
jgi:RimJ/RimL family protein N-acetyltransferase